MCRLTAAPSGKQQVWASRWIQAQAPGTQEQVTCDHERDPSCQENNVSPQERRRLSREQVRVGGLAALV